MGLSELFAFAIAIGFSIVLIWLVLLSAKIKKLEDKGGNE